MNAETVAPDSNLKDECKLTSHLIELLKQEQAQLIKADIEGLLAVNAEKSRAAAQMTELTNRRYRALVAAGYDPNEGGMRAWLEASSTSSESTRTWQELLRLAQSAKSLNNTNGMLISKHMTRNQKALSVLQGPQVSSLYGPNGQSTTKIRPRGLVLG